MTNNEEKSMENGNNNGMAYNPSFLQALANRVGQLETAAAMAKAQPAKYIPIFYPAGQEITPPLRETHEDPEWRLHSWHPIVLPPPAPNQPPRQGFLCMWQSGGGL
jgi:hypothetical protein